MTVCRNAKGRIDAMENTARVRAATAADLDAVNAVIEDAVMTWSLPDRVKRLALTSYRYDATDLAHLGIVVFDSGRGAVKGVAAWEPATPRDMPGGARALLLHGLYVAPAAARGGIGSRLLDAALKAVRDGGYDGLLVKAQFEAVGFFESKGFVAVDEPKSGERYPHRMWLAMAPPLDSSNCFKGDES
ncbi:MAG: GNAT family N-acetyltransferase [Proteobacteria bacterium]|nr:MAG: GNAT family N-acetyltransferase [Pseudomonadota bacterium]